MYNIYMCIIYIYSMYIIYVYNIYITKIDFTLQNISNQLEV